MSEIAQRGVDAEEDAIYYWSMAKIITIDSAGRLVLPKQLRARAGLHGGARLRVSLQQDRIVLEPVHEQAPLHESGPLLIIGSELEEGADLDHRQWREERLRDLGGIDR